MNKIHKVIWSRCSNAFVVVSEIASSRSAGGRTRNDRRAAKSVLASPLTALAVGVALAFGLNASALAQTAAAAGGSVLTVAPGSPLLPDLVGVDVKNTAYGNGLRIAAGVGTVNIDGGSFAIDPTAPDDTRTDTEPYAAIRIDTVAGDNVYLSNNVEVNATGDNLHGIYLADSYSWLSSSGTQISVEGKDSTGVFIEAGSASLRGGEVKVSGENAKGLSVDGSNGVGSLNIGNEVVVEVTGSGNVVGIDVKSGALEALPTDPSNPLSLDLTVSGDGSADAHAIGIRFAGNIKAPTSGAAAINHAKITVANTLGADTTGILIQDVDAGQRIDIADTTIVVNGNQVDGSTSGVKIDGSNYGMRVGLDGVALTVTGEDARGVWLAAEDSLADLDNSTLQVIGDGAYGIETGKDATVYVRLGTDIQVSGDMSTGVALNEKSHLTVLNSSISVVGEAVTGVSAFHESGGHFEAASISVEGDQSIGLDLAGRAYLLARDGTLSVKGDDVKAIGLIDWTTAELTGMDVTATAQNRMATGIELRNSIISLTGGNMDVSAGTSARGILSTSSETSVSGTNILVQGGIDAWAVVSDRGTLDVNSATIAATSITSAIGVYGSGSEVNLSGATVDAEAGRAAVGVLAELGSTLKVAGGSIRSMSDGQAVGVSSSASAVEFDSAEIVVDGAGVGWKSREDTYGRLLGTSIDVSHHLGKLVAAGLDGSTDVQILNGSSLSARGLGADNDTVIALQAANSASVSIEGASLLATGTGVDTEVQGVVVESGSSATLKDGAQVKVDASGGLGIGVYTNDAQALVFDSVVDVTGGVAVGVGAERNGTALVSGSTIRVAGLDTAIGLGSMAGGALDVSNTVVQVKSDSAAIGVQSVWAGTTRLESTNIDASGSHGTNVIYMENDHGDSVLTATGGTQLSSSHAGIVMYSESGRLHTALTDTTLTAGSVSFASLLDGDGTHRIDLGSGVRATANDGTLLHVDRDPSVPTGRVELNIADGAVVAGAIRDDAASLAGLTADGGTHVSLNNAAYAGSVQNVRTVALANNARIGGGGLAAPNTVLENVSVDNAVLSGNWRIAGTLQAGNNGRVAPGNSIGVVTAHAINWGAGTIYEVEVNAAAESDRVDVTGPGAADISQTALHVLPESGDGDYRLGHDYTILTAAGGVEGQFTAADWLGSELITVNPVYGPNQIALSLSVNEQALDLANLTANQRATAEGALSVAGLNASADAAFLSTDPAASFDLLSGEIHPSIRAGLMTSSTLASNAILGRLRDRSPASSDAEGAASGRTSSYPLWVSYAHNQQTAKGDDNTAKRKHTIDSFSLGGDVDVGAGWKVGGAFAYASSKVKLNERRSSSDIDSYGLALYAGNSWERESGTLNIMAGLGHTWHDISTRRNVDLGGAQTLKASYDARTTQLFGELGYAMRVGERTQIEPYLGLTWLQHRTDGFSESGGPAALKGVSGTDDVTFSTLGLRAATAVDAGKAVISLRGGLGWRHAFGDRDPGTKLSFIQGGGAAFMVTGAPIARNAAVFDLGAEVQVGRNTTVGLGYEGQAGSGFTEHAGNLYLKTRF